MNWISARLQSGNQFNISGSIVISALPSQLFSWENIFEFYRSMNAWYNIITNKVWELGNELYACVCQKRGRQLFGATLFITVKQLNAIHSKMDTF